MKVYDFEVIIIGGSYAGLSAAMALGRSLRKVLIIDSGQPCNKQTPHSHNFITQDGERPGVITEKAKAQVLKYDTVKFLDGVAISGKKTEAGFNISTENSEEFTAKKLIFASGIKDIMPNIKGFSACWGISVVHCPYCHGYELGNQKTGIILTGERTFHIASLVNNLTNDITILTPNKADFDSEQLNKLNKHKIKILEAQVSEIEHDNGYIKNLVLQNGDKMAFDAVYAGLPFIQQSNIPVSLGCALTDQGYIRIDQFQQTTIPGIYACGDNTTPMRAVANAVYSGNFTGAIVNKDLTEEQF